MVFYVTPGVNADHVSVSGDRVCLVRGALPATPLFAPPIGDNHNKAPFVQDYVSFPKIFSGEVDDYTSIAQVGPRPQRPRPAAPVEAEGTDSEAEKGR
jgi:hypothetical protein